VEQGDPVVEMGGERPGRAVEIGAEGDGRWNFGVVWGGGGELGGEGCEFGEEVVGEGCGERGEGGADGVVEGEFETGQDVGVEPCLVELGVGEGDEVAPLVSQAEHFGEEGLALGEVSVAVEEKVAESGIEGGVACTEQQQGTAGGLAVKGSGVVDRGEAATGAGENREGAGDLGADRVDGADVEAMGVVEEVPAELAVAGEYGAGERFGFGAEVGWGGDVVFHPSLCHPSEQRALAGDPGRCDGWGTRFVWVGGGGEVGEDAVAHLAGGLEGEGDGEDLLGLVYGGVAEELEETLDEEAGLAGAGGGFDDEGAADVEGVAAGLGVGGEGGSGEAEEVRQGEPPLLRFLHRIRRRGRRG